MITLMICTSLPVELQASCVAESSSATVSSGGNPCGASHARTARNSSRNAIVLPSFQVMTSPPSRHSQNELGGGSRYSRTVVSCAMTEFLFSQAHRRPRRAHEIIRANDFTFTRSRDQREVALREAQQFPQNPRIDRR